MGNREVVRWQYPARCNYIHIKRHISKESNQIINYQTQIINTDFIQAWEHSEVLVGDAPQGVITYITRK